jgi:thioredoxin 1
MVDLTTAIWDQVVLGDRPVLVQFWAPWCGPCRALHPILVEVARHFDRRATFGRLNVDEELEICARYGISAIPALLLFRRARVESRLLGVQPQEAVARMVYRACE